MRLWIGLSYISMLMCGHCIKNVIWPEDTEATVGSNVVFNCDSSSGRPTEWHHVPIGSSSAEISHKDGSCLNGYCDRGYSMVNKTPGEYSLRIRNVSIDDAGIHRCILENHDQKEAELNVIEVYPSKETCFAQIPKDGVIGHNKCDMEPDRLTLSCNLKYIGNINTILSWTVATENDIDLKIRNKTSSGGTKYTLILEDGHLQEANVLCRIKRLNSNITSPFEWRFHIKTVPLRQRVATVDSDLKHINCSSEIPYRCSYSWKHGGDEISSYQVLNLTGQKSGKYICYATCEVRGKSCTFVSLEVTYQYLDNDTVDTKLPEASDTGLIVTVSIPVVLGISLVMLLIVITCVRLKMRKMACFSRTSPACRGRQEDVNEKTNAVNLAKLSQEDGELGKKLLETNGNEEPNGGILVVFDEGTEASEEDILNNSSACKIVVRHNSTGETESTTPEETDGHISADTKN